MEDEPGAAPELSCSPSDQSWQPDSSALCAECEIFTHFPWLRICVSNALPYLSSLLSTVFSAKKGAVFFVQTFAKDDN